MRSRVPGPGPARPSAQAKARAAQRRAEKLLYDLLLSKERSNSENPLSKPTSSDPREIARYRLLLLLHGPVTSPPGQPSTAQRRR